ncbi:hypothetical protein BH11MYX1_BH11MYX1_31720 [soil metagenome]
MKLAVALVVVLARIAHADPPNIMLADLGLHVVGVGYQRTVSDHVALQLAAESYTPWTQEDTFFEVQGFVVRARPMLYMRAQTPTGWWLSPFGQAGVASASRGNGVAWAVGASVGYAWLLAEHVHVALGLGGQYARAGIPGGSSRPAFAEVWPTIDGSIGYAF